MISGPARRFLTALVLAAAIGGCASRAPAPEPLPPPLEAEPAPPPPPLIEPPAPSPPERERRNRVALLVPTSGGSAAVGQSIANAAAMALVDINERRFTLATYNTAGPGGARAAAEQAIAGGARVILGPLLAGDVRAAAPVARAAGVPMLSFSNDAGVAGGGVHVLGFQPSQSITRVLGYAKARGVTRFAALIPAGVYGQRASTSFMRAAGRVTAVATYTRDRRQLTAAARKVTDYDGRIARAGARPVLRRDGSVAPVRERIGPVPFQALLIADSGPVAAAFAPVLAQYGAGPATVKLIGTELWAAEPALANAPAMRGAWFAAVPETRFNQLVNRYRARHGGRPSRLASLGYDAVLLVNALAEAWPPGEAFPAARLTDRGGFAGIDGAFRLTASGVAERALEVRQIGPGGATTVSAAPTSFAAPRVSLVD